MPGPIFWLPYQVHPDLPGDGVGQFDATLVCRQSFRASGDRTAKITSSPSVRVCSGRR